MLKVLIFISLSSTVNAENFYNCKNRSNFGKQVKKLQQLSKEISRQQLKQHSALKMDLK